MSDLWLLLIWGFLIMGAWMLAAWLWHLKRANAGFAAFGWASGLAVLGLFYAFKAYGYGPRRFLIGAMVFLWGGRLAWHLWADRMVGDVPEDPRYAGLRQRWTRHWGLKTFLLFQFKGVLAVLLSVPFALLVIDPLPHLTRYEWAGLVLWGVAWWGEWTADAQLKHFRADPENQGRVCREGLWRYSRHPNYFFEWLIWMAYFVAALATPYGAWTVVCPLIVLFFLLRVTGVPPTEAHAVQSRGQDYAEYQRTTSRFIPSFHQDPG